MIREFLTIFVFLGFSGLGNAQTDLPGSCTAALPKLLEPDLLKDQDIQAFLKSPNWGQDNKTNSYWKVYSDRANNDTYTSPTNNSECYAVLDLNDELRIAKIQNGYALVYSEYYTSCIYPHISGIAKSRGWVPMDRLLLWSICPADEKGILHKAFVVLSLDDVPTENGQENKLFLNPITKDPTKELIPGMYFVMKEDKNSGMVLLSKRNILTGKTSQFLYGWVNKASYIPWNNRACLEPNWEDEAVEILKYKGINIYRNGYKIQNVTLGRPNDLGQKATKYRMPPNEMRYPLLDNKLGDDNLYSILTFVNLNGQQERAFWIGDVQNDSQKECCIMAIRAYTDIKDLGSGHDYWQPVIYISSAEYTDLMGKLQPVMAAAEEGSEDRRPFVEAMKELIRTLYGDIGEGEMMKKDTKEVMRLVAGLNMKSESLKGRSLEQIQDEQIVSQEEFSTMLLEFRHKYRILDRIKNGYKYSIKVAGETWYWIPIEDLP